MYVKTEDSREQMLEKLLGEVRAENDELRGQLARYEKIIGSTRLIMGHELRKPATAINGYLELVGEELGGENERSASYFVEKAIAECRLLVDVNEYFVELLRLGAAHDAGGTELVDLERLLQDAVSYVRNHVATDRDVDLRVKITPSRVAVDAKALKLITMNLVENALLYSQVVSPVRVEVERSYGRRGDAELPLLEMRVIDEGVGIPERYAQKVFDPFVRLHNDLGNGSGLGLTLVRSLVELNGGEVHIRGSEGSGTTVCVTLPLVSEHGRERIVHP